MKFCIKLWCLIFVVSIVSDFPLRANEGKPSPFTSLNLLPPEDISVPFDFYKVRWSLKKEKRVWKENYIHAHQSTRLDLLPGEYDFQMQLFWKKGIVASSELGKCGKLNKRMILKQGEQELHIPVCTPKGESTVSDNFKPNKRRTTKYKEVSAFMNWIFEIKEKGDEGVHNILLFGDSGTGTADQYRMAQTMQNFCFKEICDFSLMLGDNIYNKGVTSVKDEQFVSKFEKPYGGFGIDFYVTLGNHDTYSGEKGTRAQIEYSQVSQAWNMPAKYYQFSRSDADFFSIDSNTILTDVEQRVWLADALANSEAKWKIVFAHHPMYSTGPHGLWDFVEGSMQKKMREDLAPILCKNGVDLYITGHDHLLEVNQAECGVVHVISGASAKTSSSYSQMREKWKGINKFAKGDQLGFAHLTLKGQSGMVRMMGTDGEVLFTYNFSNRD